MKKTNKSQHLQAFLESVPEDGTIDRYRSEALRRLSWAEESNSAAADLDVQVKKIAAGFTTNTGIEVPEYVKPPKVNPRVSSGMDWEEKKVPVKKAPSKNHSIKKAVKEWRS